VGSFCRATEYFGRCQVKFVVTLVTNDLRVLETKMQWGGVNRNRPFRGGAEFRRMRGSFREFRAGYLESFGRSTGFPCGVCR
jgi:hypothetical protein